MCMFAQLSRKPQKMAKKTRHNAINNISQCRYPAGHSV